MDDQRKERYKAALKGEAHATDIPDALSSEFPLHMDIDGLSSAHTGVLRLLQGSLAGYDVVKRLTEHERRGLHCVLEWLIDSEEKLNDFREAANSICTERKTRLKEISNG